MDIRINQSGLKVINSKVPSSGHIFRNEIQNNKIQLQCISTGQNRTSSQGS